MKFLKLVTVILCVIFVNSLFAQCSISTFSTENSCDSYTFFEMDQQELFWSANGQFLGEGAQIDFNPTSGGTYEICGGIETPECPLGVFDCKMITVDSVCFETCVINVTMEGNDCNYSFTETGQQELFWTADGVDLGTGAQINFSPAAPGTYEVCGGMETPDCPSGVFECNTIVVEEACFSECSINVNSQENGCNLFVFSEMNQQELFWSVNGESLGTVGPETFFNATEAGTYEICGGFESPECPQAIFDCALVVVDAACFETSCSVGVVEGSSNCNSFLFNELGEQNVSWSINGQFLSQGSQFTFQPTDGGTYEICAGFEAPDCPLGVRDCKTIIVDPACFTAECAINTNNVANSCSSFTLTETSQRELFWVANGVFLERTSQLEFNPTEAGTYNVCGLLETQECPSAVMDCYMVVVEETCLGETTVAVADEKESNISVYPTVTRGNLTVEGVLNAHTLRVIDINGKTHETFIANGSSQTFDLSNLANGFYLIAITNDKNQNTQIEKIMKF